MTVNRDSSSFPSFFSFSLHFTDSSLLLSATFQFLKLHHLPSLCFEYFGKVSETLKSEDFHVDVDRETIELVKFSDCIWVPSEIIKRLIATK
ncbi:hypothetical protein CFP56_022574 [Quercus suber]|uniref:Uncharacterized protein n=1 Tax=Quercus suber TaxID=58331 RepID=A0AAW0LZ15_QUESU